VADPLRNPEPLIRRVYSYVAYRLGDGPDAEDLTSEVFERALRYRKSYDPRKGAPITWLLGIARRCVDGNVPRLERSLTAEMDSAERGDGLEVSTIRRLELADALATLDDHGRELVALRYGAGLTAREIGELLDTRTNAVEVALHRVLKHLRTQLEGDDESHSDPS
jgi:RNA polymerase sigma-70 factor, ECF subfamily